jgi:hypothetical protein
MGIAHTQNTDRLFPMVSPSVKQKYTNEKHLEADESISNSGTNKVIFDILRDLLSTANVTTGALPRVNREGGFAALSLVDVVKRDDIVRVFEQYGFSLEPEKQSMENGFVVERSYMQLRCPHCEKTYEVEIGNNPLVRDGLTIRPIERKS